MGQPDRRAAVCPLGRARRARIAGQLKKGETLHALRRHLVIGSRAQIPADEDDHRRHALCLQILVNTVQVWNARYDLHRQPPPEGRLRPLRRVVNDDDPAVPDITARGQWRQTLIVGFVRMMGATPGGGRGAAAARPAGAGRAPHPRRPERRRPGLAGRPHHAPAAARRGRGRRRAAVDAADRGQRA